jgi:hypothetical protein
VVRVNWIDTNRWKTNIEHVNLKDGSERIARRVLNTDRAEQAPEGGLTRERLQFVWRATRMHADKMWLRLALQALRSAHSERNGRSLHLTPPCEDER